MILSDMTKKYLLQSQFLQLSLLVIFVLLLNGKVAFSQNAFGLFEKNRIEAFIEQELRLKTSYFERIALYQDSIQAHNYKFYRDQMNEFQIRYNGACMSKKDAAAQRDYLVYLENSVLKVDSLIRIIQQTSQNKFEQLAKGYQIDIINKLKKRNRVNYLFPQEMLVYFDAKVIDFTAAILNELDEKKTVLRKEFYIKINNDGDGSAVLFSMQKNFISYQEYRSRKHLSN
ncbi:MAG: hypothetical protein AB8G15_19210 [Saprospiraceae bacterium]